MHATRIFRVASVCHLFGHIPAVPCICHKILVRGTPLFNSWQYFWHFRRLLGRWPWWIAIGFFDWAIFRLGIWLGSWGKGIGVSTPQPFWHESTAVTEIPLYAKFPLVRAVESTRSPRWRSSLAGSPLRRAVLRPNRPALPPRIRHLHRTFPRVRRLALRRVPHRALAHHQRPPGGGLRPHQRLPRVGEMVPVGEARPRPEAHLRGPPPRAGASCTAGRATRPTPGR